MVLAVGLHGGPGRVSTETATAIGGLTVIMTKMRKYFIHRSVVIRYKVIANDVLPVVVAMIPKAATMMVFSLIFSRFCSLMVAMC
jgi:hypothetical protein